MTIDTNIKAGWNFDNSYAELPKLFFSKANPTPVASPRVVALNYSLARALGLNPQFLQSNEGTRVLAGNSIPEGAFPIAQAYAGHQFGHFTMLGDGRAVLLGEQITPVGDRFDIQFKGPGKTPYSRGGDGRAALGPMLREYIISEAMHALGIPTTRSLAVVETGETVIRETNLPGAILTRIAVSHLRVGTFQYASRWGTVDELRDLADYTIKRHFSHIKDNEDKYVALLREIIRRQAMLIAKWQLVGFIHGVMNTDNMTISGETIDYGPCAFMNDYDPLTVFSSIDTRGRYAYGNQPQIAMWNLARLAEALLPLLHDTKEAAVKLAEDEVARFSVLFHQYYLMGMRAKLGIFNEEEEDETLIQDFLDILHKYKGDYTNSFKALTINKLEDEPLFKGEEFTQWNKLWQARLERQQESRTFSQQLMLNSNPAVIPRNHHVEAALEAAVKKGDYSVMNRLLAVLEKPYAYSQEQEEYSILPAVLDRNYRTFCGT